MNRTAVLIVLVAIIPACKPALQIDTDGSVSATEGSLMQADRDFAAATHARGIDGWMRYWAVTRTGVDAGKENGRGRYVTMWRRDHGRWLVIMDTGYPEPAATPR